MARAEATLSAGTELAGYRIEERVGAGGMGVVYRATDLRLERPVALKLLAPAVSADAGFRERFLRESKLAASLDHPNVVPVYEAGAAEGLLFIAMRFVDGSDLASELRRVGPLAPDRARRIVEQVASALDAAHARGLVHRDVKPSNVLLAGDHVYLADFGLTLRGDEPALDEAERLAGTVDYLAPEVVEGERASPQSDVYALGCLLYECLAGEPPFRSDSPLATLWAHLLQEPPAPTRNRPGPEPLPAGLDAIVGRALAKDPDRRFPTCGELARELARVLEERPEPASAPDAPVAVKTDRRTVTVLFADLSDYTRLAERLDPEELSAILSEVLSALREEIELCGGWLEKQVGDALLAVFGAPLAHEDDPERAVRAGLAMQERMEQLNAKLADRLPAPLELHVGINTGLVVVEPALDTSRPGELVVIGDAVNVGARLQQAAAPGEVLVGRRTYEVTRDVFEYRPLSPLRLKGKSERVPAYLCLRSLDVPPLPARVRSPLVGRERELAALEDVAARAASGEGRIVVVLGEAGVGKSRLLAEARAGAEQAGLRILIGQTVSFGRTLAYLPFVEILRQAAGIEDEADDPASWQAIERMVAGILPGEEANVLPALATLLAIDLPEEHAERVRQLDDEAMGRQLFRAARRTFERLALERPTALVLEDWHWVDEASAALLLHLLPLVERVPLVVCCTARSEPAAPVARLLERAREEHAARLLEIGLARLSDDESAALLANLVAVEELPIRLRERILRTCEGNAFFLEEIVRSLAEAGALAREDGGRFRVRATGDAVELPETLRGVIMARVDRLAAEHVDVVRAAAVIGRTFSQSLLERLLERDAGPALAELERLELVRVVQTEPEREYAFTHAVTRDVVYDSILLRTRKTLHERVARLVEALDADRLDELAGLLAYHHVQADSLAEAQAYLLRAGDQAGRLAANAEALEYYARAYRALAEARGGEWSPLERAELERKMGDALWRRGDNREAAERLTAGLASLGLRLPTGRTGTRLAIAGQLARQLVHRALPDRGGEREVSELARERSALINILAWIHYFGGKEDRDRMVLDALLQLNLAERDRHVLGIARGSSGLGFICDAIPLRRAARFYHDRCLAHAELADDAATLGLAHLGCAHLEHHVLGDWDRGLEHYRQAAAAAERAGHLRTWGAALLMLSGIPALRGSHAEAAATAERIVEVAAEAGALEVLAWGEQGVGRVLFLAGDYGGALHHLERGAVLAREVPSVPALVTTLGLVARCRVALGEDAGRDLEEARTLIVREGLRGFHCTEALVAAAEARLAGGQARAAARAARRVVRQGKLDSEARAPGWRVASAALAELGRGRAAARARERAVEAATATGAAVELAALERSRPASL